MCKKTFFRFMVIGILFVCTNSMQAATYNNAVNNFSGVDTTTQSSIQTNIGLGTTSNPTFNNLTVSQIVTNNNGVRIKDVSGNWIWRTSPGETFTSDHSLTYYPNDSDRKIWQYGDVVLNQNVTTDSTTARTASLTDSNSRIQFTNTGNMTFTIPLNSSVAIPVGSRIRLVNKSTSTGLLSLAIAGGVTLNAPLSLSNIVVGQSGYFEVVKTGTDTWDLDSLYESVSATISTTGGFVSTWTVKFTRINNEVLMTFPNLNGTFTNSLVNSTLPHARFYPAMIKNGVFWGQNNNVNGAVIMVIDTSGNITIGAGLTEAPFTSGPGAIWGSSYNWNVT